MKLLIEEPESTKLRELVDSMVSCGSSELVVAELLRGVRRRAADDGRPAARLVEAAQRLIEGLDLFRLDRGVISAAGRLDPVRLRTLDAIHVATALRAMPLAAFVSYDSRQLTAADALGLPTASPGVA